MKRLCIVTPAHWSAINGGSEQQIKHLIDLLIERNTFEIFYIAYYLNNAFIPHGYRLEKLEKIIQIRKAINILTAPDLYKRLRALRPDIIYQRVGCAYTGVTAYYARQYNCKLVWHISSDANVMPLKNIGHSGGSLGIEQFLEKIILDYGARNATKVIAQTTRQSMQLKKHYGRPADVVIPNYQPEPNEKIDKSGKPIRVIWISNIKPMKRPEIFLKLASDCRRDDVEFLMVGRVGNSEWSKAILSTIQNNSSVSYLGERSQDEVNLLLAEAHILVNTSSYEGFPNTFIQAWMREVPVVSLDVDPDGVLDRENIGRFAGTYDSLLGIVNKLLVDERARQEIGITARKYAENNHSLINRERIITELEK